MFVLTQYHTMANKDYNRAGLGLLLPTLGTQWNRCACGLLAGSQSRDQENLDYNDIWLQKNCLSSEQKLLTFAITVTTTFQQRILRCLALWSRGSDDEREQ